MRLSIGSETDFEDIEDEKIDTSKISLYKVKAKLFDTPQETIEKKEAILEQIKMGIIDKRGIPVGMIPQKSNQNKPKAIGKLGKKLLKQQQREKYKNKKMTLAQKQTHNALLQQKREEQSIMKKLLGERNGSTI